MASVFASGYLAPLVVKVREDNLERLATQAQSIPDVAQIVTGVRDVRVTVQMDYPEVRVDAGQVRPAWAESSCMTQLRARLTLC